MTILATNVQVTFPRNVLNVMMLLIYPTKTVLECECVMMGPMDLVMIDSHVM